MLPLLLLLLWKELRLLQDYSGGATCGNTLEAFSDAKIANVITWENATRR
jgi:hypothetical protein